MNDFILSSLNKLKEKSILNPEIDLRILLNHSKNTKHEIFLSNFNLDLIDLKIFNILLTRRLANEPISKIINKKSFWKDDFYVNKFVLDPRPETEFIIEESLKIFKNKKINIKILDIGTGSGAIAISLAREFKKAKITAIDISDQAIQVARKNIIEKKLDTKIELKKINIDLIEETFDLIVSNPPYLTQRELETIPNEIKYFEPSIALNGGKDGLNFYRKFAIKLPKIMKPNSKLILEIGESQYSDCRDIFSVSLLKFEKKIKDLQKKDRIMVFSKI